MNISATVVHGITGLSGSTGSFGVTGHQGITGVGMPAEDVDLEPIKEVEEVIIGNYFYTKTMYKDKKKCYFHCPFGPAISCVKGRRLTFFEKLKFKTQRPETRKEPVWIVNCKTINDIQIIKEMLAILDDITIAPLYLNDPILSYPARWVLKYGSEKRDVDE